MVNPAGVCYDLAVDLGSTNVCLSVLADQKVIFSSRVQNSLYKYGPDIITRLTRVIADPALTKFYQTALISDLNYLLASAGIGAQPIRSLYLAANTVMLYFMFAKDPSPLGRYPFTACIGAEDIQRLKQTLIQKKIVLDSIFTPPVLGGYVGADMASVLYYLHQTSVTTDYAVVDIGTNAEIAVREGDRYRVSSVAAGAAFGFNGSELIAKVAAGLREGRIAADGLLASDMTAVSQAQVRNLQLAKSAVYTGVSTLMQMQGRPITKVYVAGVFGGLLAADDIRTIGLLPAELNEIDYCGNASLSGLEHMIRTDTTDMQALLPADLEFVELANSEIFSVNYVRNMNFSL